MDDEHLYMKGYFQCENGSSVIPNKPLAKTWTSGSHKDPCSRGKCHKCTKQPH